MNVVLVTPPAQRPIEPDDVIVRVETLAGASPDAVGAMIDAAVSHLDGWTGALGRCLVEQTWKVSRSFLSSPIRLPFPEAREVIVRFVSASGSVVVPGEKVFLGFDAAGPFVRPKSGASWPTISCADDAVEVEFKTGYGGPAAVPSAIKQAIVMMVSNLYAMTSEDGRIRSEQVDGVSTVAFNSPEQAMGVSTKAIDAILSPFRRLSL